MIMIELKIYNNSNLDTTDFENFISFQDDFKIDDIEKNKKLQNRIVDVGFKYPVYAWEHDNKLYVLDAHQRLKALKNLSENGYTDKDNIKHDIKIPEIPYIKIFAESKKEAKKEILYLNSRYAEIELESDFVNENFDIDIDVNVEIPELDFNDEFSLTGEDLLGDNNLLKKPDNMTSKTGFKIYIGNYALFISDDKEIYDDLLELSDKLMSGIIDESTFINTILKCK